MTYFKNDEGGILAIVNPISYPSGYTEITKEEFETLQAEHEKNRKQQEIEDLKARLAELTGEAAANEDTE